MRLLFPTVLLLLFLPSCSSHPAKPQTEPGRLLVHVFVYEGQASPERKVELLQTGDVGVTDLTGVVEFGVQPGDYTIRAHVGTPGPALPFVERTATVLSDQTTRVEVFDCRYCRGVR